MSRLEESKPSEEDNARIERCLEALRAVIAQLGDRWRVSPFGSAANGFLTKGSDLDVTCHEVLDTPEDENQTAVEILNKRLTPYFEEREGFAVCEMVVHARIPILKLRFEDCLEVDLSCNNTKPIHNTRLLKAYASIDSRVRDVGIAVKIWAKAAGVCGASSSHLSSYTWMLMVVYFMQVDPKVELPRLPVQAFENDDGEECLEAIRASWPKQCSLSVGQLLLRFFQFYNQDFYWGSEVVSLRYGSRLDVREPFFDSLKGRHHPRLHVEDPCDPARNLNCVLGEVQEFEMYAALQAAWQQMQQGLAPEGLHSEGEVKDARSASESTESTASSPGSSALSTASTDDHASCEGREEGSRLTSSDAFTDVASLAAALDMKHQQRVELNLEAYLLANFRNEPSSKITPAANEEVSEAFPQTQCFDCQDLEAKMLVAALDKGLPQGPQDQEEVPASDGPEMSLDCRALEAKMLASASGGVSTSARPEPQRDWAQLLATAIDTKQPTSHWDAPSPPPASSQVSSRHTTLDCSELEAMMHRKSSGDETTWYPQLPAQPPAVDTAASSALLLGMLQGTAEPTAESDGRWSRARRAKKASNSIAAKVANACQSTWQ
eukprot:TRINITY_DN26758_c0_g2_i1.p1 TRINITY_DN26758_c0_g2~~TRINITY_DN26758_c0_g2_i1.p1  ORF type:complete len:700 (+),score=143.17 TRINITY_DN26758_c0_g2_i1:280-2100(+)